jgi:hypothetical protein
MWTFLPGPSASKIAKPELTNLAYHRLAPRESTKEHTVLTLREVGGGEDVRRAEAFEVVV